MLIGKEEREGERRREKVAHTGGVDWKIISGKKKLMMRSSRKKAAMI